MDQSHCVAEHSHAWSNKMQLTITLAFLLNYYFLMVHDFCETRFREISLGFSAPSLSLLVAVSPFFLGNELPEEVILPWIGSAKGCFYSGE